MKKLKSSEPRDRLSELTDSLIFNIFEFLPMQDVVRTTILSHRWKNLWITSPNLNFDNSLGKHGTDKFRNFVNRALLRWRGTRVQKFKVSFHTRQNSLRADVDLWVRFAIDNGVQDLYISRHSPLPQCLYSSPLLEKLCLRLCRLKINGNVEWNQLKSLTIFLSAGVTQHVIDQILRGSPLLEVFTLSLVERGPPLNLRFESSSLKDLSIWTLNLSKSTELRICTPNLETLTISGDAYEKYSLENVSSLTHATIGFHGQCLKDLCEFELRYLPPSLQDVDRYMLDWCFKMSGKIGDEGFCRNSPLPNVKYLKLCGCFEELEKVLCLLEIFPNIETLVLQANKGGINQFNAESNLKFKPDDPSKRLVTELRTVEVSWSECDFSMFPLIEILLKYASNLERMVFRVKGIMPLSNSLLLVSQKLLRLRRSSPNAELIFCEY